MDVNNVLYHGSRNSNIKILEPKPYPSVSLRPVVFASDDKTYAVAMIFGTGKDLAVSFAKNGEMYIDELSPNKLGALNNPGYLYTVGKEGFVKSPEGLEGEYVCYHTTPVLIEEKIANVKAFLEKSGAKLIAYEEVPMSMEDRGKKLKEAVIEHKESRFK